jgi:Ca-activated chloride channel family protein
MLKRCILIFLLVLIIVALSEPLSSHSQIQKPEPPQDIDVIRVSTTLVTVPVSVMDRNGRFIPDLKQEQFHLFEDGVEQQIALFENAQQPFTIALLLDVSDSTAGKLTQIKDAALAFVNELRADDRLMVVTFDKRITILCEATNDRRVLDEAIRRAQSGGGTSLYSAIDLVITKRLKQIRGRKAIVLFTDGVDTTSRDASYESTLRTAEELDAMIYSIQYNTYPDVAKTQADVSLDPAQGSSTVVTSKGEPLSVAYKRAERYLQLMPDKTGGRSYKAATLGHLKEIFARIASELREQYSLGYYPSNKSATKSKRELKVKVSVPNVAIRSRRSYIYVAPSP